jgi:ligand-binding sensor domain-containing protein
VLLAGGTAWQAINTGLPTSDVHGLALDSGGNLFMGGPAGLFRLSQGGLLWQQLTMGLPSDGVQRIAFGSGSTVFVGTFAHGIYVSSDSGSTWTADNSGIVNSTSTVGAFATDAQGFLYAAVGSIVYRSAAPVR